MTSEFLYWNREGPNGLVERFESRGYRERHYPIRRAALGIIIHTTGAGPWRRWQKAKHRFEDPYDAAKFVFRRIVKTGPHFIVCADTGRIAQCTPLAYAAWHTGSRGAWRYRTPGWDRKCKWWRERWPELQTPRDLLDGRLWQVDRANALTFGIEVSPPRSHPRGSWDPSCWESLAWLAQTLAGEHGFPVDHYHVFTHSDAHPRTRTRNNRPWDPGANQWFDRAAVRHLAAPLQVGV